MTTPTPSHPTYPDVEVRLSSGVDGNAFVVISKVVGALKQAGLKDEARIFLSAAFDCDDYDAVLRLAMRTVTVV